MAHGQYDGLRARFIIAPANLHSGRGQHFDPCAQLGHELPLKPSNQGWRLNHG